MLLAPEPHLLEDRTYGRTVAGNAVLHFEWRLVAGNGFGNDTLLFQLFELLDEDAFAHLGKFAFDLTVPSLFGREIDEDLCFIFSFDDLQKGIDRTINYGHGSSIKFL